MKKQYADSRTSKEAMGRLRTNLRDVQNVMVTNIQDVMSRGDTLQGKDTNRLYIKANFMLFRFGSKSYVSCFDVSTIS